MSAAATKSSVAEALVHTTGAMAVIDHWQTLVGAALGATFAIIAALIVAWMAARRERRIAASMVLPEAQQLTAAQMALSEYLDQRKFNEPSGRGLEQCRKLVEQRPEVSALYTPMIGQLSDIDARLYSHLFQCQMTHQTFERELASFEQYDKVLVEREKMRLTARNTGERLSQAFKEEYTHLEGALHLHAMRALRGWTYCAEHAELAAYFIDRLVFNRWPNPWHRFRMRLHPNDLDRRSMKLLQTGHLLKEGVNNNPVMGTRV